VPEAEPPVPALLEPPLAPFGPPLAPASLLPPLPPLDGRITPEPPESWLEATPKHPASASDAHAAARTPSFIRTSLA
jgi:hypothetical protein